MTGVVIAAPHLFEPVAMPEWMQAFVIAVFGVVMMDAWADKIPGVKGINRLPQTLVLVSAATAVSTLLDTDALGSISDRLGELSNNIAAALSGLWNIGGAVVAGVALFFLARRYMSSEKLLMDGVWFGLAATGSATLIPWIAEALEFWRFSVISGSTNIAVVIVDTVTGWSVTA